MNPTIHSAIRRLCCTAVILLTVFKIQAEAAWTTDFNAAFAKATKEKKLLLLNFTGSDWCGWCIKLHKEVFAEDEFAKYAEKNLILVELDFPRNKTLPDALRQQNESLMATFKVEGFPTLVLLSTDKKAGLMGYVPGGPKAFIGEMEKLRAQMNGIAAPAAPASTPEPAKENPDATDKPTAPEPKPEVTAPLAPVRYDSLILKAITGSEKKRLALINNVTFEAGEEATVKLKDGSVKVRCLEINESSAIVTLDGKSEKQELRLIKP